MSGFFDEEDSPSDGAQVEGSQPRIRRPGARPEPQIKAVMPPDDGGGFFGGNQSGRPPDEDPFGASGSEAPSEDEEGTLGGIEAVGDARQPHQQQRDKTYDVIGKIGRNVGYAAPVADFVFPGAGKVVGGVGAAIKGAATVGRGLGNVIDDAYDRDDANRHEQTQKDIARMKDQAARDKVNQTTPRGHNKLTED